MIIWISHSQITNISIKFGWYVLRFTEQTTSNKHGRRNLARSRDKFRAKSFPFRTSWLVITHMPGRCFTKDFSSPNQNLLMLLFRCYLSDHHEILHMHRQHCCRCMCKILWCSDAYIWSYGWMKFGEELWRAFVKHLPELPWTSQRYVKYSNSVAIFPPGYQIKQGGNSS